MSVATLSGLAAKEVIVSTLVPLLLGDEVTEEDSSLREIIVISIRDGIYRLCYDLSAVPCRKKYFWQEKHRV